MQLVDMAINPFDDGGTFTDWTPCPFTLLKVRLIRMNINKDVMKIPGVSG